MTLRVARVDEGAVLCALIFEHGPNAWNWLPEESVHATVRQVELGQAQALVAEQDGGLLGAVIWRFEDPYPALRPLEVAAEQVAYVVEAVVNRGAAGQGLGSRLLMAAAEAARQAGARWLIADRHEENLASAGMMRKAGMETIQTYSDPQRRSTGSRCSAVCARML